MTSTDVLLLLVGLGIVGFLAYQRLLAALISLVILWLATLLATLGFEKLAYYAQGFLGPPTVATEGFSFILLLILLVVGGYQIINKLFPDTTFPKLGIFDYIGGGLVGMIVAALVIAVIVNALGYRVSDQWPKQEAWIKAYTSYSRLAIRPFAQQMMSFFQPTLAPFFRSLPPILQLH